jgi:hypothetical protein
LVILWPLNQHHQQATPSHSCSYHWDAAAKNERPPPNWLVEHDIHTSRAYFENAQYTDPRGYRENERADRDLRAQEDMAFWAKWMAWLTGWAIIVTVIGIILVALTLHETRRATKAATQAAEAADAAVTVTREIGAIQTRAYVAISDAFYSGLEEGGLLKLSVVYKNVGQTPARHVCPVCDSRYIEGIDNAPPDLNQGDGVAFDLGPGCSATDGCEDLIITKDIIEKIQNRRLIIAFFGKITYQDIFGCDRATFFMFELGGDMAKEKEGRLALLANGGNQST